jgi:hypothetical protein
MLLLKWAMIVEETSSLVTWESLTLKIRPVSSVIPSTPGLPLIPVWLMKLVVGELLDWLVVLRCSLESLIVILSWEVLVFEVLDDIPNDFTRRTRCRMEGRLILLLDRRLLIWACGILDVLTIRMECIQGVNPRTQHVICYIIFDVEVQNQFQPI